MTEGGAYYETAVKPSLMQCDAASQGGPGYLEMGTEEKLLHTVTLADGTQKDEAWTIYNFPP